MRVSAGDDFCGGCGAFADWQGESPAPAASPPEWPAGPEPDEPEPACTEADGPSAAPAPPSTSPAPPPPAAVQPGAPAVRAPAPRAAVDDHVAAPDDLHCAACATANPAARSFCRRCGAALAPAAAPPRLSWWRRCLRWWRRRRTNRRRGPSGRVGRVVSRVLVLALLAALVDAGVGYGPRIVNALRDRYTAPAPVHGVSETASSAAPGHPASDAVDGTWNHYWAPADPPTGPPVGEWLEVGFARPFRLLDLVVHSGASDQQDEFLKQARPAQVEITVSVDAGRTVQKTVQLEDKPAPQTIHLPVAGVTRIRLTIRSVYGMQPSALAAVGEVEFFERP
ncbi:discoidin domain-containing protein [Kitasatospora sp. MAA4]|uniref:discoidin domain-containing protein n=1 Tax=Kitasatospora sp. MAA4 TaxID=3035093 RepID=UPI0024750255|nr:discoidin domain-containing protein [Kitasatospora sp. MAA4]